MYSNIDRFVQGFAEGGGVGFERGRGSMYDSYPGAKRKKEKEEKEKEEKSFPDYAPPSVSSPSAYEISEALGGGDDRPSVSFPDYSPPSVSSGPSAYEVSEALGGGDTYTGIPSIAQDDSITIPDDPYLPSDREVLPGYITGYTPETAGRGYGALASEKIGEAATYFAQNPVKVADAAIKGLGSLAVGDLAFTRNPEDYKFLGGLRDMLTGVYDSAGNLITGNYGGQNLKEILPEMYQDHENLMRTDPEYAEAVKLEKMGDVFNVGGALLGGSSLAKQGIKAGLDSNVAKALRGELGEEFYGPDGPQVAPNVGGFTVPETPEEMAALSREYGSLKAQGLSDYEIERQFGIKAYKSAESGNMVVGKVIPSDQIDVSSIPYAIDSLGSSIGRYYPSTDTIAISNTLPLGSDLFKDVLRHEGEHSKQRVSGNLGGEFGAGGGFTNAFSLQQKKLEDLNRQIRNETDFSKKAELIAERDRVATIDAAGSYYNSPKERGARQAQVAPFKTYDPSITATELLDPTINIGKGLGQRLSESFNRAVLPTYGGLSRFREMGPRIPFTDQKLFSGLAEAGMPLARYNIPLTPSTRGNKPVPYLTSSGNVKTPSYSEGRKGYDFVEEFLSKNKPASANLEFMNKKKEMVGEGMSGSNLEFALNNLARRLGIERPDK